MANNRPLWFVIIVTRMVTLFMSTQKWSDMLRWACQWLELPHLDKVDRRDAAAFVPLADHGRYGSQALPTSMDISELDEY